MMEAMQRNIFRIGLSMVIAASLSVVLVSCETSAGDKRRKKNVKLPGEDEVSTLGWGRAYPGDAQPGVPGLPGSGGGFGQGY